jgi:formamidopyrimidine-DNA glycosylase
LPELPEVETIRRDLEIALVGRDILGVEVFFAGSVACPSSEIFATGLVGRRFTGAGRRGKYLLLYLDDHSVLVVHLRMTGRLLLFTEKPCLDKHSHLLFKLSGQATLLYHDVRKFGRFWWLPAQQLEQIKGLAALGPEPLSPAFHFPYLDREAEKRTVTVKALLLDQTFLAGLGNIYTDEILFACGILPGRSARSLSRTERRALFDAIRHVLQEALAWRGTTLSDYRDASGETGLFQNRLNVYGRHKQECPRCSQAVCRSVVAGRGTHYCSHCQH